MVNVQGYDPTAAAVAQNRAAAQNEAMIATAVETGQRNLSALEQTVIKDNTLLPGEWYGGQLQFDAPNGDAPKSYGITVQIGNDTHQFDVVQGRQRSEASFRSDKGGREHRSPANGKLGNGPGKGYRWKNSVVATTEP